MLRKLILIVIIGTLSFSCAKRGTITGGDKDILPPKILSSNPKNLSTQFKNNTIKIVFDEYVKLKDIQKQLIVSPPMEKMPTVMPQSGTSKYLTVKLNDSLKANTTYTLNFGQSVVDNNEGNAFPQLKYVFSTGNYVDSLYVRGTIKDAFFKKPDNFVTVMLYEVNEKYNDSTVFKEKPMYISNTLDSLKTFKIENIKAGKYKLFALKEKDNNYKFNPKTDKIAFYEKEIIVPDTSFFELKLHKEKLPFAAKKVTQASGNKLWLGFEGKAEETIVKMFQNDTEIPIKITPFENKDSIQIWYKNIALDSISVQVKQQNFEKIFKLLLKNQKKDTLKITNKNQQILINKSVKFSASNPIEKWDESKMQLFKKDSIKVSFKIKCLENKQEIVLEFEKEENQKYKFKAFPGAFEDFVGQKNDSLKFNFETQLTSDYGTLKLNLSNVKSYPVLVELTNANGDTFENKYIENGNIVEFLFLEPKKYFIRAIYDTNKNKTWDTGNYLQKQQAEEVIYFKTDIDIRANWDVDQNFDLKVE